MSPGIKSDNKKRVLITGVGGPAGRSAARYLLEKGYYVIGTDIRPVDAALHGFHIVPAANDPSFLTALRTIVHTDVVDLLIPTVSEELPVIARDTAQFTALGCHVAVAPYAAVSIANDKLLTARCLEMHDIAVPITLESTLPYAQVIKRLGMPLLAKPRISRGGRGVIVYGSASELANEQRQDIVYQKFIPGQEYDVNLYMDRRGQVQACVVLIKTSLREGIVGNALGVERAQRDDVGELARRACMAIGLSGPADIDVRIDAAGVPRLLEINARIGANVLMAEEVMAALLAEWQATIDS